MPGGWVETGLRKATELFKLHSNSYDTFKIQNLFLCNTTRQYWLSTPFLVHNMFRDCELVTMTA